MGNLETHANTELTRAGLFSKDSDYGGMIGDAVMELVRVFAAQGHSGFSAGMTLEIFRLVASYKPLSPITSDPDEWMDVAADLWQNRRQSSCFSTDGGKTYYDVDVGDGGEVRAAAAPKPDG